MTHSHSTFAKRLLTGLFSTLILILCCAAASSAKNMRPTVHAGSHCRSVQVGSRRVKRCGTVVAYSRRSSTPQRRRQAHAATGPVGSAAPVVAVHCDLYAATNGSDNSDGSQNNPFATLIKLDQALTPGQTGCLRAGTYGDHNTWHKLTTNGQPNAPITITAYPGETATITGWLDIEAGYTTISGLNIDGSNNLYPDPTQSDCPWLHHIAQALVIAGPNDILERNNIYQSDPNLRGNGIGIGWWGNADNTIIRYNRIHDVGACTIHDHLIYLESGNNVQIYDNWMWNAPHGRGVLLYPHPTNSRIYNNVISGAQTGFGLADQDGTGTVSGNQIWHNVVINSIGWNDPAGWTMNGSLVQSPQLASHSTGNHIYANDSYNNPGGISTINSNITSTQIALNTNTTVDPQLANPGAHDFTPSATSPDAGWGLWVGH